MYTVIHHSLRPLRRNIILLALERHFVGKSKTPVVLEVCTKMVYITNVFRVSCHWKQTYCNASDQIVV